MKSAKTYQDEVDVVLGVQLDQGEVYQWDFETVSEAKIALADIRQVTKQLEEIRRAVTADMKSIRDDYRDKMANAAAGSSTAMSLLGRKQKAGQMKADAKKQLRVKRNEALVPYNDLKSKLDRLITDLGKQAAMAQKVVDTGAERREDSAAGAEKRGSELETFYFDTPPAGRQMPLTPTPYTARKPVEPPQEFVFDEPKPEKPKLQEAGLRGLFSGSLRKEMEEQNRRLQADYERRLESWENSRAAAESALARERDGYAFALSDWQKRKESFETAETDRLGQLEEARRSDPSTMRALLGRRLDNLSWPPQLETVFATDYTIEGKGALVRLEVCLPKQEEWPGTGENTGTSGLGYIDLVHAIGFRHIGEIFYVLPVVQTVILSGYVEDSAQTTGYENRQTLYSSKVSREEWHLVDFEAIESLDMVGVFNLFETRRQINEGGHLAPVQPFRT